MHSVNTHHLGLVLATGTYILVAQPLHADNPPEVYERDYHETVLKFHASQSSNASFLTDMQSPNLSFLEWNGHIRRGELINYYQSDESKDFEITTGAYYRFNERLMLSGAVAYRAEEGKHMSGSLFIDPEYAPFDIVEMDESNAGRKRKEWYSISGKAGYALNSKISLGASFDYSVGNYAKFKDLRHQNTRMNLRLAAGGKYQLTPQIAVGLSYAYHRNIEKIALNIYGNTDRQYTSLISFGGFYGRSEVFGESGYTSDALPLFTQSHSGSGQFLWTTGNIKWFHELSYGKSQGRFGTDASTSITFSRHHTTQLEYTSKLTIQQHRKFHVIELRAYSQSLENKENSYKTSTDANGVSQIVYYGQNKVGEKSWRGANISYTLLTGEDEKRSDWSAGVAAGYDSRLLTATVYPFYRKQDIHTIHAQLFAAKRWSVKKQFFSLSWRGGYTTGWGTMMNDGTYTAVSESQKVPDSLDFLLGKEYDYHVAQQIEAGITIGYERGIYNGLSLYATLDSSYRRALNRSLKGEHRMVYALSIGVKF